MMYIFCFKQKTAYEMRISDWSSDVCSSDLSVALLTAFTRSAEEEIMTVAMDAFPGFATPAETPSSAFRPIAKLPAVSPSSLRSLLPLNINKSANPSAFRPPDKIKASEQKVKRESSREKRRGGHSFTVKGLGVRK